MSEGGGAVDQTGRFTALDGLRGLAAVIVVFYHAVLASPWGNGFQVVLGGGVPDSRFVDALANTPLRYFVMGPEAVIVFFVLSGFVLIAPLLGGRGLNLWSYYPRRVLRLWLPSAAAMVFAVILIVLTAQRPDQAPSEWGKTYSFPALSAGDVLNSFFFLTGDTKLNNPLWTLRWELLFSLLLPLAFLLVVWIRRWTGLGLLVPAVAVGVGNAFGVPALTYGSVFLAGGVVAVLVSRDVVPRRPVVIGALALCGLLLMGVPDAVRVVLPGVSTTVRAGTQGLVVIGAALIVLALTQRSPLARLFGSAPMLFLGRISFSLYLVHVPILIASVHLAPGTAYWALPVAIASSFIVAWLFMRFVEQPSARFARTVGGRVSAFVSSRGAGRDEFPEQIGLQER
ncbi:acyltransferase [Microbacterium panaciterrae]|uniref:Acyltransferase 3 domain-containing protein n=1 Tax=Microbacterium panaciterrae TaxID=985759 RepID=A0ABP8PEM4_9MICO